MLVDAWRPSIALLLSGTRVWTPRQADGVSMCTYHSRKLSELLAAAAAASVEDVAAEAVQDPYKLMSIDDLFAAADLVHLGHHCLDCRDRLVGEDAVQALCDCQPLP